MRGLTGAVAGLCLWAGPVAAAASFNGTTSMMRGVPDGQYICISGHPVSYAVWGYPVALVATTHFGLFNSANVQRAKLNLGATGTITFNDNGQNNDNIATTATVSAGAWHVAFGQCPDATARSVAVNDTAPVPRSFGIGVRAAMDRVSVGVQDSLTSAQFWNGQLAYAIVWDGIELDTYDKAAIYHGWNPLRIKPRYIKIALPMLNTASPGFNWAGTSLTTVTNVTASDNAPPVGFR